MLEAAQALAARRLRPLLSIIIPSLDADIELRRCVDSIRLACASRDDWEILVVCPQRRVEAVRTLLPSVMVVAETRGSIYGAMNDGVDQSLGRYLYFIGKDDIVFPQFAQALEVLTKSSPSALFFDVYWGTRGIYSGVPSRWRVLARNVCHQGVVYSREVMERHGPYVRKMRLQADHLLNIRLLWDEEVARSVRYLPLPLVWYSGAGYSVQMVRDPVFWRLYPTIMRRNVGAWAACLLQLSRVVRGRWLRHRGRGAS
jgi:glycosyltransferase involved in cell wall biosynthesis